MNAPTKFWGIRSVVIRQDHGLLLNCRGRGDCYLGENFSALVCAPKKKSFLESVFEHGFEWFGLILATMMKHDQFIQDPHPVEFSGSESLRAHFLELRDAFADTPALTPETESNNTSGAIIPISQYESIAARRVRFWIYLVPTMRSKNSCRGNL